MTLENNSWQDFHRIYVPSTKIENKNMEMVYNNILNMNTQEI